MSPTINFHVTSSRRTLAFVHRTTLNSIIVFLIFLAEQRNLCQHVVNIVIKLVTRFSFVSDFSLHMYASGLYGENCLERDALSARHEKHVAPTVALPRHDLKSKELFLATKIFASHSGVVNRFHRVIL